MGWCCLSTAICCIWFGWKTQVGDEIGVEIVYEWTDGQDCVCGVCFAPIPCSYVGCWMKCWMWCWMRMWLLTLTRRRVSSWFFYYKEQAMVHRQIESGYLTILRVGCGSEVSVQIQSDGVLWTDVHWAGKRSLLCVGEGCPLCLDQVPRTIGFLCVLVAGVASERMVPALLEVGQATIQRLLMLRTGIGSGSGIAGLVCSCFRKRKREAVRLEPVAERPVDCFGLSSRWRIIRAVGALYRLPTPVAEVPDDELAELWRPGALAAIRSAAGLPA